MKKLNGYWIILCLCFFYQYSYGQKHMKFMGIDIDGNVEQFCANLLKLNRFTREKANIPNAYCFVGKFYDEEASIRVEFDSDTKNVHSVAVDIVKDMFIEAYPIQRDILKAIEDKYTFKKEVINEKLYQYDYYIFDDIHPIGLIQTYIVDSNFIPSAKGALLNITYIDVDNILKHENRKRKDI